MSRSQKDEDRYLSTRNGLYQYKRRVPLLVGSADARWPTVRQSLKTDDVDLARMKRDVLERADDDYWAAMLLGADGDGALRQYEAAVRRAEALGFAYRTPLELISMGADHVLARFDALSGRPGTPESAALLGVAKRPRITVKQAFKVYIEEIVPADLVGKSAAQKTDWKKVKQRAVNNFVDVVGDVALSLITRDQARKFHKFWLDRIAPADGAPTHTPSSGNRDLGNMRQLFERYHAHIGQRDAPNPFDGLSFSEKVKRSRPAFSVDWLRKHYLRGTKIMALNPQARGIVLLMIETGARPSELANLGAANIVLKAPVPYISIEPRIDPEDPREIKTGSSVRQVPLVGVALEVAKRFPGGFPRYWNKERTLSNTLNKTLDENGLLETKKHTAYGIRHSFEDRLKEAHVDEELRRAMFGHTIDRPKYGSGGSLKLKQAALKRIVLPFDSSVLSDVPLPNPS